MPLEDEFCDIIKKARIGQGLSMEEVARAAGLPGGTLAEWERGGKPEDRAAVGRLAAALGLRPAPLAEIAIDRWEPVSRPAAPWIETIHGSVGGYAVQGYLLHDEGEALVIDTAYDAPVMIEALTKRRLTLVGICLTHGHGDHADGIDRLLRHREVPVYLGSEDVELLGWKPRADLLAAPKDGQTIPVGRRTLRCLATPGHTPGGTSYCVDDERLPVCFVGDTLFAGSIGRSNPSALYRAHLRSVRERVLGLPSAYRLLPGHGPATTVEEELTHNPFFV